MIRETIVKTRNFPKLLTLLEFIIVIRNLKLKSQNCIRAQFTEKPKPVTV